MTFLEKYRVNISEWSLNQFKSALNFYLNVRFDINNVLIFTKYYTYYHQCKFRKEVVEKLESDKTVESLSESEKYEYNSRVFGATESLVDMRALFTYLVDFLGTKQAIDPVTKQDALWHIIDFFTKPGISNLLAYSASPAQSLSDQAIAKYLRNRLGDSKSFERTT